MSDNEITAKNIKKMAKFCKKTDILLHDAQYTEDEYLTRIGWGHSSQTNVLEMSKIADVKKTLLTHHDPLRNDIKIDVLNKKLSYTHDINSKRHACQFTRCYEEFLL